MSFFFQREETDHEIIIRHKPWWLYLALVCIAVLWVPTLMTGILNTQHPIALVGFWGLVALVIWRLVDTRAIRKETFGAISSGSVQLSGSRFNPSKPLTVTITKAVAVSNNDA